jgi:hypothetical protein
MTKINILDNYYIGIKDHPKSFPQKHFQEEITTVLSTVSSFNFYNGLFSKITTTGLLSL